MSRFLAFSIVQKNFCFYDNRTEEFRIVFRRLSCTLRNTHFRNCAAEPNMLDLVHADLTREYRDLSYKERAFHLEDSKSFRAFDRLELG